MLDNMQKESGRQLKEDGTYINRADLLVGGSTIFNQRITVEPTQQFVYKSVFPISSQRDKDTTTGDASISQENGSEYRLRTTSGTAMFQTKQSGDYIPYSTLLPGVAVRTVGVPTGNAKMLWGYFDYNDGVVNGIFVEYNASGLFHKVVKSGVESYSQEITVNTEQGKIYQFPFVYYGYGFAGLDVVERNNQNVMINRRLSTYYPDSETIMDNSNLPLSIRVEGDGAQLDVFVGGRHISVLGKNDRVFRTVSETRKEQGSIGSTNYYPLLSVRQKTAFKNIFTEIGDVEIISDADLEFAIFLNPTLTGASFGAPSNYFPSECATEWDKSATAVAAGQQIFGGILRGGSGQNQSFTSITLPDKPLTGDDIISFCVRRISGTNATASMNAKVRENW